MKGCLTVVGILVVLLALGVLFVLSGFQTIHVRYRITLEVQDGDQIRSRSSVLDAAYPIEPDSITLSGPDTFVRIKGYAPTVDLREEGLLFLTFLDAPLTAVERKVRNNEWACGFTDIGCLPSAAYRTLIINRPFSERMSTLKQLLRQKGLRDVSFIVLPALGGVSDTGGRRLMPPFKDTEGPHKLLEVKPDDLAASFGPGVQLKRVTLELTDEPVTRSRRYGHNGSRIQGRPTWAR